MFCAIRSSIRYDFGAPGRFMHGVQFFLGLLLGLGGGLANIGDDSVMIYQGKGGWFVPNPKMNGMFWIVKRHAAVGVVFAFYAAAALFTWVSGAAHYWLADNSSGFVFGVGAAPRRFAVCRVVAMVGIWLDQSHCHNHKMYAFRLSVASESSLHACGMPAAARAAAAASNSTAVGSSVLVCGSPRHRLMEMPKLCRAEFVDGTKMLHRI